jgi:transaldolase / glucose-6-phosphate isomerase
MKPIDQLHKIGQSLWYDNIQRNLLENGQMAAMISWGDIRGVTSNPSIFNNAISKSHDYDSALIPMAWAGWSADRIFDQLAIEDIQAAADLFQPLYKETSGGDGFVSLEVNPLLAHDSSETLAEAQRLWKLVNRPNLMVKIPATPQGIPAIQKSIAAGLNVNITLIFSIDRYKEVMEAYLSGLEERAKAGLPLNNIASVASFFVSRVDTKVDPSLNAIIQQNGSGKQLAQSLLGKIAIANTALAYALFKKTFSQPRFRTLADKGARLQRPLWASTSTKNPAYPDLMYVNNLIAPDTVNTVPPQTLDAFRDHGEVQTTLEGKEEEARALIASLESLGILMSDVTHELEDEGVKTFSDAFVALRKTIEEKSSLAQAALGSLKQPVAQRIEQLEQEKASKRMFANDATLWTSDSAGQNEIRKRLGWLKSPQTGRDLIPELRAFAIEAQSAGYKSALLLGMGGSSLAPEVMANTFGIREDIGTLGLDLSILDSTDPAQVRAAARRSPIEDTLYIISSKSGGTGEVKAFLDYFWDRAHKRLGNRAAEHFIAITDPGTSLEKLAVSRNFRHVFRADPSVGGRYSALVAFGLVPAALLGLDVERLLNNAGWMAGQCSPNVPAGRDPGLVLGAIIGEAALHGRDKLTILADPEISSLGSWLEQLVAESSGKQGKGIVPVDCEPPVRPSVYGSDRLFVYLRQSGALDQPVEKLLKTGQPVITLPIPEEYHLGAEFYRWSIAIAIACSIIQVNGFDQPDVQDSKDRTCQKIAELHQKGTMDEGKPIWNGEGGRIYGKAFPGLDQVKNLAQAVEFFLKQAKTGDYVALNAYLPRNNRNFTSLQKVRAQIVKHTGMATTLGFGPRFLHSTGQLHKGGPNSGLFLQVTADASQDLAIPGEDITFGQLERAQALGDLEALLARDRRAIRIHLDKDTPLYALIHS